jgi:periplasmic protein CpxP/Spy
MRKTLIPLALAVAAASPLTLAGDGHRHQDRHGSRVEFMVDHLLDDVDATEAQRSQIEAIQAKYESQIRALHQDIHEARRSESALDPMSSSYLADAGALIDRRSQLSAQSGKVNAQMKQEIAAVLTDEQRAKMREKEGKMRKRHRFMHD